MKDAIVATKSFLCPDFKCSKTFSISSESDLNDVWAVMMSDDVTLEDLSAIISAGPKMNLTLKGWRRFPRQTIHHVTGLVINGCDRIFYYPEELPFPDLKNIDFYFNGFIWPLLKMPQYQNTVSTGSIVEAPPHERFIESTGTVFLHDYGTYRRSNTFYKKIPNLLCCSYPKAYLGTPDHPFDTAVSLGGLLAYPQTEHKVDLCKDNTVQPSDLKVALPTWCKNHLRSIYYQLFEKSSPQDKEKDPERVPLAVYLMALPEPAKANLFNFLHPGDALSLVQAMPELIPYVKKASGTWGGKIAPLPKITRGISRFKHTALCAIVQECQASSGPIRSEMTLDHITSDPVVGRTVYQTVHVTPITAQSIPPKGHILYAKEDPQPDMNMFLLNLEWRFTQDGPLFFSLGPAVIEDDTYGTSVSHPDPQKGAFVSNLMATLALGEWCQIMNPRGQDKITWPR